MVVSRARKAVQGAFLVFCGATLGTFLRAGVTLAHPAQPDSWPWTTFAINLIGAFVLGVLLESLAIAGTDDGRQRIIRLTFGTGVLGGFTTYSTYVLEITQRMDAPVLAVTYALVSMVLGVGAAGLGIGARQFVARRSVEPPSRTVGEDS